MASKDISREDALALLAEQDIKEIIKPGVAGSMALDSFRTVPMSKGTAKMPVMSALPVAGWVGQSATAPEGVKPVSNAAWTDKHLVAEEIAVIVPIHENLLDDSDFDIWGEIKPYVRADFGRLVDLAVFQGVGKPTTWTDPALIPGAIAAGNTVTEGTGIDLAEDFNLAFATVEDDDFDVDAVFTGKFMRSRLRGLRNKDGDPIYLDALRSDGSTASIYGENLRYAAKRSWNKEQALSLVGDSSAVVMGLRQDVQVKLLDQATIELGDGTLVHLAQRDMVALRFKFRVAFATAFSTAGGEATDYPFGVIVPKAGE